MEKIKVTLSILQIIAMITTFVFLYIYKKTRNNSILYLCGLFNGIGLGIGILSSFVIYN